MRKGLHNYGPNYKKSFEIRVWRWSCRSGKTRRCRYCTTWSCLGPMNMPVSVLCGLALSWSDEHTGIGIVRLGLVLVRRTYRYRYCAAWLCLGPMNILVSVLWGLALSWSDEHTGIGLSLIGFVLFCQPNLCRHCSSWCIVTVFF